MRSITPEETKKLLTKLFSTNNLSVLPIIADLAYKIELLEKRLNPAT